MTRCALLPAAVLPAAVAHAQIIRPDSATATSQFSSGYVVTNAINGSGLPANFAPTDAHATYASGNHWTTANGRTIGESATFNFIQPQTLGGFYMWQHRSNGVASNPYYAVVRFDLVLKDASNNILATFPNLTALPNIAQAQTIPFTITSNVSSVQFIVRETNNNNSSPYTGLAEVAFDDCIPATAAGPQDQIVCPTGEASFSAGEFGSEPFTFQWQTLDNDQWRDLDDGPLVLNGSPTCAAISGTDESTLVVSLSCGMNAGDVDLFRVRCIVTNTCGQVTTTEAVLDVCPADFNCDGTSDFFDYLDFVAALDVEDPIADFNGDQVVDFFDYLDFAASFDGGC